MRSSKEIVEEAFKYHKAGDLKTAANIYDQMLGQLQSPDVNVLYGYGTLLASQQQYGLASYLLRSSLKIAPNHAPTWTNYACAMKFSGNDAESLFAYEKALELEPNAPDVLAGIAGYWINKAEPLKVEEYARRALAVAPEHDAARMHLALSLLEQGRLTEAWPYYEARWETLERKKDKRPYKAPRWKGERVTRLAIHGEQGLGDEILFMSLFPKAKERAYEIVIECAERLIPTFGESFKVNCYKDHAAMIENEGEPDAYIPMGSLPLVLGSPDGKPFLKRNRVKTSERPLVGIAWKGGTIRTNVRDRSLNLVDLKPILDIEGIDFISVQYGGGEIDNELRQSGLVEQATGFDGIHHRIAQCDLVITVCQTAVHQAGAMGVPCWVLTPHKAAWRYCGKDMMPWYECVQIFRQGQDEAWAPVIEQVAKALGDYVVKLAA